MFDIPITPTSIHHFVEDNAEALQNAALLLGGQPWLKRVQKLFESLAAESPLPRRTQREITALLGLLTLEHVHDPYRPEAAYFAVLDPSSPYVEEICLLADDLRRAIDEANPSQRPAKNEEEITDA